jgi:hypothetical protein
MSFISVYLNPANLLLFNAQAFSFPINLLKNSPYYYILPEEKSRIYVEKKGSCYGKVKDARPVP